MEKFNVNACTKFSVIEELNSEFTLVKVYVMGCAAQNRPEQFADRNVEFVVGTAGKKKLLENLQNKGQQLLHLLHHTLFER